MAYDKTTGAEAAGGIQDALPPLRGLVLTYNHRKTPFALTAIKKWIRLSSTLFKVEKIDLMISGGTACYLNELAEFARHEKTALSLRIKELDIFEQLPQLMAAGIHDVFMTPDEVDGARLASCISVCKAAGLPARVQLLAPAVNCPNPDQLAEYLKEAVVVNVALTDPFSHTQPRKNVKECDETVAWMNRLVRALDNRNVEANLIGLPYCHVDEANYPHAQSEQQYFLDHQHYAKSAYDLAQKIYRCGPHRMDKVVENLLSQRRSLHNGIDKAVLPWILEHPRLYARVWMFHKFTRHLRFSKTPAPLPENPGACEAVLEKIRLEQRRTLGPECARCCFQKICDHETKAFREILPCLRVKAQEGCPIVSPLVFSADRIRYYDAYDAARVKLPAHLADLAETVRATIMHTPPTREIAVDAYEIEGHYNPPDDASRRWYSFSNCELLSTVLTRLEPPFTLGLTFGGGIAEHIGFSFGRHLKILCPMIDYSHKLTLHVDKDGYYVLLRDGVQVRPTEFDGASRLPVRLSGALEPRISIHNVDGFLITQTLLLWEGASTDSPPVSQVRYSVIIVSTRYTRRLQATLLGLAHQKGIDPQCMEVVVAYVPGIDGTDDLIESMGLAHPHLRIVRSSFSENHVHSKGFMINESLHVASGEWIVLMDSDIVAPPDLFEKMEAVQQDTHFIAPDGRKMLTPEMTGRILLGEARPWEEYDAISETTKDYRYREGDSIPCGFFQCIRREILKNLPYHELDHFEASDWIFARDVVQAYGKETRLEGVAVLHLDHGGRQWYGTAKHR